MSKLFVNTIAPNSGDTVTISGSLITTGKLTIGDASTDTVAFEAEISSSLLPDVTATYDLGTMSKAWRNLHAHGLGHIHTASINVVSSSLIPDGDDVYDLGSSTKQWKDLYIDGTANIDILSSSLANIVTVDISSSTTITASIDRLNLGNTLSRISGSLLPHINNVSDLGSSELQFRNLFLDGTASIDITTIGRGEIVSASITTASFNKIESNLIPLNSGLALGTMADSWGSAHVHGLAHIHTASIGEVTSSLIPSVNNDVDLGSNSSSFANLHVNSSSISYLNLGNDGTKISGSMIPSEPNIGDLGIMAMPWRNLHAHGLAHIHTASINLVSSSLIPSNAGSDFALGTMAQPWASLHVHGVGHIHTASLNLISSSLLPIANETYNLGSSGLRWNTAHIKQIGSSGAGFQVDQLHVTHITASNLMVSGVNLHSSVLASVDAAHLGSADGFKKFSVQGQLQAALADGATSAEFTVGNTDIALGDIIVGTAHGALMGGLSQSNMIITTRTANSMSFVFNNESGLVAVDDSAFTASFAIIK